MAALQSTEASHFANDFRGLFFLLLNFATRYTRTHMPPLSSPHTPNPSAGASALETHMRRLSVFRKCAHGASAVKCDLRMGG